MDQQPGQPAPETRLEDWKDVKRAAKDRAGLYPAVFTAVFMYLVVPCIIEYFLSYYGYRGIGALFFIATCIVDLYITLHPTIWLVTATAGYGWWQIGGQPWLSHTDGIEGVKSFSKKVFEFLTTPNAVKWFIMLFCIAIPTKRLGQQMIIMMALAIPVFVLWIRFGEKNAWIAKWIYGFLWTWLVWEFVYTAAVGVFPSFFPTKQFEEKAVAAEQAANDQREAAIQDELERIRLALDAMPKQLTLAERVALLPNADRLLWNENTSGSTVGHFVSLRRNVWPSFQGAVEGMFGKKLELPASSSAAAGCKPSFSGSYNPGKEEGDLDVGTMCPGTYRFVRTGERQQAAFKPDTNERELHWMSACGVLKDRGATWIAPASMGHPLPGEPVGTTLIQVGTEFIPVCRKGHEVLTLNEPTRLKFTLNVAHYAANFGAAPRDKDGNKIGPAAEGSIEVWIVPDRSAK